jgi:hypothetical protein
VIVFHRASDGTLSAAGSFPTGGKGMGTGGDPLASQGAVVLDKSNRFLFVVNAGSNDLPLLENPVQPPVRTAAAGSLDSHTLGREPRGAASMNGGECR